MHYHVSQSVVTSMFVSLAGLALIYVAFALYLRWKFGPAPKKKKSQERSKRQPPNTRRRRQR